MHAAFPGNTAAQECRAPCIPALPLRSMFGGLPLLSTANTFLSRSPPHSQALPCDNIFANATPKFLQSEFLTFYLLLYSMACSDLHYEYLFLFLPFFVSPSLSTTHYPHVSLSFLTPIPTYIHTPPIFLPPLMSVAAPLLPHEFSRSL